MGLPEILEKIKSDARKEIDVIDREKDALRKEYSVKNETRSRLIREDILSRAEAGAIREKERIMVEAEIDHKKEILKVKYGALKEVFEAAGRRIREDGSSYAVFLKSILDRAAEKGDEIVFSPSDKEVFSRKEISGLIKEKGLRIGKAKEEIGGGLIIRRGKKEINAGLENLLQKAEEQYGPRAAAILFS